MDMIKVKYVGQADSWSDNLYGSGGTWTKGSVVAVNAESGEKLLKHPEFERVLRAKDYEVAEAPPKEVEFKEEAPLVNLEAMTKQQLTEYAHRYFGVVLNPKEKADQLRETVRLQMGKRPSLAAE